MPKTTQKAPPDETKEQAFERVVRRKLMKVLGPLGAAFLPVAGSKPWDVLRFESNGSGRDAYIGLLVRGIKSLAE